MSQTLEHFYFLRTYPPQFGSPCWEINIPDYTDPTYEDTTTAIFELKSIDMPIAMAVGGKLNERVRWYENGFAKYWTWNPSTQVYKAMEQFKQIDLITDISTGYGEPQFQELHTTDGRWIRFHGPLIFFRNEETAMIFKLLL